MRQFMRQQLASTPCARFIGAFTKEDVGTGRKGGGAQPTIQGIGFRIRVNTDVTKVHPKGGLHRAACLAIESVSSMTGSPDRRFDIRGDGGDVSCLTADGQNPLHIAVAKGPLHRKQGRRGCATSAAGDAVRSLDMAGHCRPVM